MFPLRLSSCRSDRDENCLIFLFLFVIIVIELCVVRCSESSYKPVGTYCARKSRFIMRDFFLLCGIAGSLSLLRLASLSAYNIRFLGITKFLTLRSRYQDLRPVCGTYFFCVSTVASWVASRCLGLLRNIFVVTRSQLGLAKKSLLSFVIFSAAFAVKLLRLTTSYFSRVFPMTVDRCKFPGVSHTISSRFQLKSEHVGYGKAVYKEC